MNPVRLLAYLWAAPASAIGLGLALCARAAGAGLRRNSGVLEVSGAGARWCLDRLAPPGWRVDAATFGHVVLARDASTLELRRQHELRHVRQFERWGALLLPLYPAAAIAARLAGRDGYRGNRFEIEASKRSIRSSADRAP